MTPIRTGLYAHLCHYLVEYYTGRNIYFGQPIETIEQDPPQGQPATPPLRRILCYKCAGEFLSSTFAGVTPDDVVRYSSIFSYTLCVQETYGMPIC